MDRLLAYQVNYVFYFGADDLSFFAHRNHFLSYPSNKKEDGRIFQSKSLLYYFTLVYLYIHIRVYYLDTECAQW